MTLYRLMHGATWYSEASAPKDIVPDGGFAKTLTWLPHIPDGWRRLVRRTLHDNSSGRYQTATELFAALGTLHACDWRCAVTPSEVRWEKEKGGRKLFVTWSRHSKKDHEWHAWSEPSKTGKIHKLGGSDDILSRREVEKQLQAFFRNNP